jgi:2-succinyl-5-enolpyruvyl-6-hydroxy-3-cyclohexene-1-carboxylate synthase
LAYLPDGLYKSRMSPINQQRCQRVIQWLTDKQVGAICVCAGGRNAPLVELLAEQPDWEIYQFFEERSAAFFALGLARRLRKPVAVCMTSGTAVAECLPAVVEAHYQGIPLLVLSGDRPRRFRGTGGPQAIEQKGIFGAYVEGCLDLEEETEPSAEWQNWHGLTPFHLNLCLEEPRG